MTTTLGTFSTHPPLDEAWPSLSHLLRDRARRFPEREFLRFGPESLTFAGADERSGRLALALRALGVERGDRVAVMLPNGLEFPLVWLALAELGAVIVPINTQARARDLAFVLRDSGARLAVGGPTQVGLLREVQPGCPELHTVACLGDAGEADADLDALAHSVAGELELPSLSRDDVLNIQYTSGTTGFPKGCVLTHGYWLELAATALALLDLREDDVNLTAQPFSYMDPQWNTALCLLAGVPLVILPRFSATTFWSSVGSSGATFCYLLGTMPVMLLRQPEDPAVDRGHRLRLVVCSGIVPALHDAFEARWGVPWFEAFGMTETGLDLAVTPALAAEVPRGSVGRPVPGKAARVVDTAGHALPPGEVGELAVSGWPMMRGYWNDPEATARTLRGGWLHTGDLARQDESGNVFLVGRLKDMVRRGGENVAAAEVEAALCEHLAVLAAAVVPVPDEVRGEEVGAFVQVRPGEEAPPEELLDFLRVRLAPFKVPRYLAFVDGFPRTPSERVAKHALPTLGKVRRYDGATRNWRG